ncbi:hypothetical protein PFY10_07080 [Chryseobacterium daecheongense]|uniref:hypothetical protein n=2 Tax=Chryseobacterium TaxID=59732 RepID=UPI001554D598|nr:hypothetical protein [Chryseobacterium sp. LAM-KRS1]WBV58206.1 hypothetical protein PFY10_07080 [Chryseobacterium daecheongense]
MKKILALAILTLGIFNMTSCTAKPSAQSGDQEKDMTIEAKGKITKIENGKDGYMATIQDADGKEYVATISIVNLQKSGSTYKRYEVGDSIYVKGPSWKDDQGKVYIKAEQLKQ